MTTPDQLPLPLPARAALGRDEFFVSSANAMAVALVESWQMWSAGKMALCGPAGSGKTHLAHVWAKLSGARIVPARGLSKAEVPDLAEGSVCVEDIDEIAGDREAEETLFHLHNLVLAQGHKLMVTAAKEPAHWGITLPDLQSRMMGAQVARLEAPDDALLTAVLAKLFADRQLTPGPEVLMYLARHMPRDYATARETVAELDRLSLAEKRKVTRAMAASVLNRRGEPHT
jgi:DnaA regulatory inactivator Hda